MKQNPGIGRNDDIVGNVTKQTIQLIRQAVVTIWYYYP